MAKIAVCACVIEKNGVQTYWTGIYKETEFTREVSFTDYLIESEQSPKNHFFEYF